MKIITESKQVGTIYYLVGNTEDLSNILRVGHVYTSDRGELPYPTKRHVSFTRDWRNQNSKSKSKWKYGIIINGSNLSNKYHIEPYSYVGAEYSYNGNLSLEIKYLISYDNNKYLVAFVNWGTYFISKEFFEELERKILNWSGNEKAKLKIQKGGKITVSGVGGKIVTKYLYDTKQGGVSIRITDIPKSLFKDMSKTTNFNEREERIWTDNKTVDISNSIEGIIIPEKELTDLKTEIGIWKDITTYLNDRNKLYKVVTY